MAELRINGNLITIDDVSGVIVVRSARGWNVIVDGQQPDTTIEDAAELIEPFLAGKTWTEYQRIASGVFGLDDDCGTAMEMTIKYAMLTLGWIEDHRGCRGNYTRKPQQQGIER